MGRPISKKYFGNRNIGSASTTADDGIGGNKVASVTLGTLGAYTVRPTVTFSAPDLAGAGAVTATGTVTSEALSAVVTVAGDGYSVGDLLTVSTAGGTAVFEVATLTGVDGSGVATVTVSAAGSFTTLEAGAQATTTDGAGDDDCTLTITYRAKAVVITEQGSGYTDAADAAPTFTQSVTGTSVLEVDSGAVRSATNQENAISIYAYIPASGTAGYISGTGGSSRVLSDIVRQSGNNKYVVKNAQGVGVVRLQADGSEANAAGEADITATDWNGSTYRVVKLHANKARLKQVTSSTAFLIDDLTWTTWTLSAATGTVVTLANA